MSLDQAVAFFLSDSDDHFRQLNAELERRVTERTRALDAANRELVRKEQALSDLTNSVPVAVYRYRREADDTPRLLFVSDQIEALWGVPAAVAMADPGGLFARIHPDDLDRFLNTDREATTNRTPFSIDLRVTLPDGRRRWMHLRSTPRQDSDGLPVHVGFMEDITSRKETEEQLRDALREKETLLKEVHHRVKNNLQVMISLLALQAAQVDDPRSAAALQDSQDRLRSMALIHEQLYQAPNLGRVDMVGYVSRLAAGIHDALSPGNDVTLDLQVCDARLAVDAAIPCGLILNELISNAMKHAFPAGRTGSILVSFQATELEGGARALCLSVSDDGIGLSASVDPSQATTLGLRLVQILTHQLNGTLSIHRGTGTRFEVTFPEQKERTS
jgi:PAS domain S-box-containing protein